MDTWIFRWIFGWKKDSLFVKTTASFLEIRSIRLILSYTVYIVYGVSSTVRNQGKVANTTFQTLTRPTVRRTWKIIHLEWIRTQHTPLRKAPLYYQDSLVLFFLSNDIGCLNKKMDQYIILLTNYKVFVLSFRCKYIQMR